MSTKGLLTICEAFQRPKSENVVIEEPYIPYIPDKWNYVLVLAESQNLSSRNSDYVQELLATKT